jgi:hypothetical protein
MRITRPSDFLEDPAKADRLPKLVERQGAAAA